MQQLAPQQFTPFSHPQVHPITQLPQTSQNIPLRSHSIAIHPPSITNQIMSHHPHHSRPSSSTQIISTPFIDQSSYLTAIPVQPVQTSSNLTTSAAIITPLPPPSDFLHSNVVLTPAQNQIQDHLQRKHEELQKLIVQQQDELRRVSEQLFMARYGIIPSIVNVSLPFVAPIDQTNLIEAGNRCMSSSSHLSQQNSYQHQPQMIQHQILQAPNPQVQVSTVMHHQSSLQQQHMTLSYDMSKQQHQNVASHIEQSMESDASGSDIMHQYMHQQPSQLSNMHQIQQQSQQQQMMSNDDFELIPFQMMNQQAQVLYANENNTNNNNNTNSANSSASNNK